MRSKDRAGGRPHDRAGVRPQIRAGVRSLDRADVRPQDRAGVRPSLHMSGFLLLLLYDGFGKLRAYTRRLRAPGPLGELP